MAGGTRTEFDPQRAHLDLSLDFARGARFVCPTKDCTHSARSWCTRWLWLNNWSNLSVQQQGKLHRLMRPSAQLATARARRWRQNFQAFANQDPNYAAEYLRRSCAGSKRSRLQPAKDFLALVENHWDGILAWHASHLSNGLLDRGINSLVYAAETRARGYRNKNKMITVILPHGS